MTVVVVIFLPLVLAYQTWTYYVFRRQVSREQFMQGTAPTVPPGPVPAQGGPSAAAPGVAGTSGASGIANVPGVPSSEPARRRGARHGRKL